MLGARNLTPIAIAAVLLGCGRSDVGNNLPTYPIGGIVTVNGQPSGGISVAFHPIGNTPGRGGYAVTDAGGRFAIMAADGREGVPNGEYKVLLAKWTLPDGSPIPPETTAADAGAVNQLPEFFSDPARSPALVRVLTGANPDVSVDVRLKSLARW